MTTDVIIEDVWAVGKPGRPYTFFTREDEAQRAARHWGARIVHMKRVAVDESRLEVGQRMKPLLDKLNLRRAT